MFLCSVYILQVTIKKNLIWYMIDICFAMLVETWWKEWWWPAGWISWQWQQLQSRWVWRRKWHSTWEPGERRGGRWSAARWWAAAWTLSPSSVHLMICLYDALIESIMLALVQILYLWVHTVHLTRHSLHCTRRRRDPGDTQSRRQQCADRSWQECLLL